MKSKKVRAVRQLRVQMIALKGPDAHNFAKAKGLPPTPTVKTGRGYHCYFKYRNGVRNFQKRDDLPGIDLRGDGGYVVAPPLGELPDWGATLNMGNYEAVRCDVAITIPCMTKDFEKTFKEVKADVMKRIKKEVDTLRAAGGLS